eukprot:m.31383 g.31383  ORF g.31383 m.31383 type:complete len:701 (-) comp9306_c0_seq2:40-2142(-)
MDRPGGLHREKFSLQAKKRKETGEQLMRRRSSGGSGGGSRLCRVVRWCGVSGSGSMISGGGLGGMVCWRGVRSGGLGRVVCWRGMRGSGRLSVSVGRVSSSGSRVVLGMRLLGSIGLGQQRLVVGRGRVAVRRVRGSSSVVSGGSGVGCIGGLGSNMLPSMVGRGGGVVHRLGAVISSSGGVISSGGGGRVVGGLGLGRVLGSMLGRVSRVGRVIGRLGGMVGGVLGSRGVLGGWVGRISRVASSGLFVMLLLRGHGQGLAVVDGSRAQAAAGQARLAVLLAPHILLQPSRGLDHSLVNVLAVVLPVAVAVAGCAAPALKLTQLLFGELRHKGIPGGVAVEVDAMSHVKELVLREHTVLVHVSLALDVSAHAAHLLLDRQVVQIAVNVVQLACFMVEDGLQLLLVKVAIAVKIMEVEEDHGVKLLVDQTVRLLPDLLELLLAAGMVAMHGLDALKLLLVVLCQLGAPVRRGLLVQLLAEPQLPRHLALNKGLVMRLVNVCKQLQTLLSNVTQLLLMGIRVVPQILVRIAEVDLVCALGHAKLMLVLAPGHAPLPLHDNALLLLQLAAHILVLQVVCDAKKLRVFLGELLLRGDGGKLLDDLATESLVREHGLGHLIQVALILFVKAFLLHVLLLLRLGVRLPVCLLIGIEGFRFLCQRLHATNMCCRRRGGCWGGITQRSCKHCAYQEAKQDNNFAHLNP